MSWLLPADIGLIMGLIFALPVVGFALSFRLFSFPDLTLEGSVPTGAAVFGAMVVAGAPVWISMGVAAIAGACLGVLTAAIHIGLHVNKFLAGIIAVAISYTLDLRIMDAPNVGLFGKPTIFHVFAVDLASGWQFGTIILLGIIVTGTSLLLLKGLNTLWGLRLRVAGSNPIYGRSLGIRVGAYLIGGLALTNAIAAASGAVLAMYQGFADIGMGQGVLILALASTTIGERLAPEKRLSIPFFVIVAAVLGSVVYEVLLAYAVRLGLAASDLKLATAVFVLMVIAIRIRREDDRFLEALR